MRPRVQPFERDECSASDRGAAAENVIVNPRRDLTACNVLTTSVSGRFCCKSQLGLLFADVVGFTALSATMSSLELVTMLNELFARFDRVVARHGLEKIKTIGDCYMVASGIPHARDDHLQCASVAASGSSG